MALPLKLELRRSIGDFFHLFRPGEVHRSQTRLIVLMYHAVTESPVSSDPEQLSLSQKLFRRQMGWLKELKYPVLPLLEAGRQLRAGRLSHAAVAITFDDGYLNVYTHAFPILQEYGYPATVFLVPGAMKGDLSRDFMRSRFGPPLGWAHAREMLRYGIRVGAHGMTHRKLSRLPEREVDWEASQCKKVIENALSTEVNEFSYPYGSYDSFSDTTESVLRGWGFEVICTAIAGQNFSPADATRLKRLRVSWLDDSSREVQKQCLGCYNWYALYQRCAG